MSSRLMALVLGLLIAVRVALLIGTLSSLPRAPGAYNLLDYDAARYYEIARGSGTPYRDFEVEVPPLELGAIHLLDAGSPRAIAVRLGWAMFALDLFVAGVLWKAWGRRATLNYLVLGLPLCFFIYFRLDLLSVALATLAVALARRGHERSGGVTLAASAFAKLWPLVLLPIWFLQRRTRSLTWSIGGLALGVAAWVSWTGWSGPVQVATFRNASGWHFASVVGNIVDIVSRAPTEMEQGTLRVGTAPLWARAVLLLGLMACSSLVWIRCSRRPALAEGLGALCAVAAVLVFAPLLSDQYVFWLLPWAAIAADGDDGGLILPVFLVVAATAAIGIVPHMMPSALAPGVGIALIFLRNALLVFLLFDGLRRLRPKDLGTPAVPAFDRGAYVPVRP
jgi:hypothetical protein